jgi:hypothetical protein
LQIKQGGDHRPFHDGSGLCSPGRWEPSRRQGHSVLSKAIRDGLLAVLSSKLSTDGIKKLAFELACSKHIEIPFDGELLKAGADVWKAAMESHTGKVIDLAIPAGQPFRLFLLRDFLEAMGDPDFSCLTGPGDSFERGVRMGIGEPLPRVPEVFEERTHFRKYDEDGQSAAEDRENYSSASGHVKELLVQFEEEIKLGAMIAMDEEVARREFGENFLVAALGAIEKGDGSFRVIHDGTHGVGVNPRIKILDQQRCPTAAELRLALRKMPTARFSLAADIKRAHRLVKVRREDWGFQACKVDSQAGGPVYLNTVGTFGIASAAYHWQRLAACITRAILYIMAKEQIFQLIFADDLEWITAGPDALHNVVLSLFVLSILGAPLSWKKTKGGIEHEWIGFWICLRSRSLGISERRAA